MNAGSMRKSVHRGGTQDQVEDTDHQPAVQLRKINHTTSTSKD